MSTMPGTRSVCWHEASHAASLLISGLPPLLVRVDNVPGEQRLGSTRPDWETHGVDPQTLREVLISVLLGPICDGEARLDDWPINPDDWEDNPTDAEQIAFIADVLHFDEVDYRYALHKATSRSRDLRFRRLAVAITDELENRGGLLLQPELVALAERLD